VVDHLSKHGLDPNLDAWKARLVCMSAAAVGATDISGALFPNVIESLRSEGRLGGLLRALVVRSFGAAHDGDLITAYAMAGEAGRVAEDNGEVLWRALGRVAHALVHAMRGEVDAAERTFARAEHFVITSTIRPQVANLHIARGIQAFAAGRLDDAYGHLRTVVDPGEPTHARIEPFFALSYFADVAAQLGRHTEARELVAAKRRAAHTTTAIPIHNQILYAEIRLDDSPDFESRARMVLANEFGRQPFLRARLELALGSWLRRERRPTEARSMLRSARDTLDTLGVRPWAERARQELRATGETSPSRPATGLDYLTPQELQIAEMAARGLSNREIGQRLFLSHRTVGSHLYRIFPKLEVTNRAQLADALDRQQVALQQTS
jgi:DNA-binding NarL/FixJ family response regulator